MILIINLNASVDKHYTLNDLCKGTIMRARRVENTPGGKGIHVANVITILGEDCLVTGFLGGKSGEFVKNKLNDYTIKHDFVKIANETRSCLAISTDDGSQTEILEPGPWISAEEQQQFLNKYNSLIEKSSVVIASGSLPQGIQKDFYSLLISIAHKHNKKFLLDTSNDALKIGLTSHPYLIKPNKDELYSLTGNITSSENDIITKLQYFMEHGTALPIISLGSQGSLAGFGGKVYKITVPVITAINPVGSGDAYIGGIAIAISKNYSIEDALKLASACGTANALEQESGFVSEKIVNTIFQQVQVKIISG